MFDAPAAARRMGHLALSPEVLGQILELTDDSSVGSRRLAGVAQADPGFTTEILRTVNTAHQSFARRIDSVSEAITLLGARRVRNLALTLLVRHRFLAVPNNPYLRREDFWRHSIGTAVAAENLVQPLDRKSMALVYTAGLLHDLGILLLGLEGAAELEEVCRRVKGGQEPLEADRDVLGATHAEIGAQAAETWSLPEAIRDAAGFHHAPSDCKREGTLVHIVCVADVLMSPETPTCYGGASSAEYERSLSALRLTPESDQLVRAKSAAESLIASTLQMFTGGSGGRAAVPSVGRRRSSA